MVAALKLAPFEQTCLAARFCERGRDASTALQKASG
jgi:hypothetical protein